MLDTLLDINQLEAGIVRRRSSSFRSASCSTTAKPVRLPPDSRQSRPSGRRNSLTVRSDPRLLEQTIHNLVSNAVKYTEARRVLLGCRRRGDKLRIEVWDTGIGIPAEQLSAIFEEFHQIDNPARERSKGLGLGLAIVQRLAELLGHTIDVRSRPGRARSLPSKCLSGRTN